MSSSSAAAGLLSRQLKQMQNDKDIPGISCGLVDNNVFEWEVMLMINDDTKFYGGMLHNTSGGITITDWTQEDSSAHASPSQQNTPSYHQRCASRHPSFIQTVRTQIFCLRHSIISTSSSPPHTATPQISNATTNNKASLRQRRSMHLDPAPPRRRQIRLRIRRRTLVTRPNPRNHITIRDKHAEQSKRRESGKCGGGGAVEGQYGGIQEESEEVCEG